MTGAGGLRPGAPREKTGPAGDAGSGAGWAVPPADLPARLALARELHITPVTAQILLNRGLSTVAAARAFLQADAANLLPPENIPGLAAARERLARAVEKKEKILIHGDYDVDGLAATAIMLETLSRLGVAAEFYLPDRLADGYGLKENGLARAVERGCSLVVTVDCGITSVEEARQARQQGLDLVITDHHRPGPDLPPAVAVVNPLLAPCLPPLCGAGVAFKLAQSLAAFFGLEREEGVDAGWALDLVALATIADAVPLLGENRLLVQLGLPVLARGRRPGLQALAGVAGLPEREWTAREVAFSLIPRLNACGRLGDAVPALELLITTSARRALELAAHLQQENQARRLLESSIATEAEAMAIAALAAGDRGLVLASAGWHPGVIGIVAARLVEKFNCPVILVALEGDTGRGSGRSTPDINLHEVLAGCASHLLAFGGHAGAAGLEIAAGEIPAFRAAFNDALASMAGGPPPAPAVVPEAEVLFSQLDWQLLAELESLAPHGEGNPRPLLFYNGACLKAARQVGSDGAHLKLLVTGEGRQLAAIGFNMQLPPGIAPGDPVDLAFYLERDNYQGREELQLLLAAVRPAAGREGLPVAGAGISTAAAYLASQVEEKVMPAVMEEGSPAPGKIVAVTGEAGTPAGELVAATGEGPAMPGGPAVTGAGLVAAHGGRVAAAAELLAATGEPATGEAGAFPAWGRQLAAALGSEQPPGGIIFATSLAVRQCYQALKRCFKYAVHFRPLVPWLGREGVQRNLDGGQGGIITCHPFWPAGNGARPAPLLLSPLVAGVGEGNLLQPSDNPDRWQVLSELLPLLTELLARGRRVLLYARDGAQMLHLGARLQQELPGVRLAVDTFTRARHLLLAREGALSGQLPLLVARREMPAWFYPAEAVIFVYCPGSREEVEIALPPGERAPEVFINTGEEAGLPGDLRQELANFYRQLQKGTNNGSDLYIINNKGYHQRWYLAIFEELGLVRVERRQRQLAVRLQPAATRSNLLASRRYRQLVAEMELAREFYRQLAGGR